MNNDFDWTYDIEYLTFKENDIVKFPFHGRVVYGMVVSSLYHGYHIVHSNSDFVGRQWVKVGDLELTGYTCECEAGLDVAHRSKCRYMNEIFGG